MGQEYKDELAEIGMRYNIKRIRRLLRKIDVQHIYPKRNLSRLEHAKYVHPSICYVNWTLPTPISSWAIYIPLYPDEAWIYVPNGDH